MHKHVLRIAAVAALLFSLVAAAPAQTINTFAGGGPNNLAATLSSLGVPWAVVQDANGNTYISDNLSNRVFKVNNGTLTVLAGIIVSGGPNFNPGGQPANQASLSSPRGIALDSAGNVYIADTGNNVIRVVNTQSTTITIAGVQISPGNINTVAGTGTPGYSGPGAVAATSAELNGPSGVWLDSKNNIYIADTINEVIEVVNTGTSPLTLAGVTIPANDLATVAGNNTGTFGGDGGPAKSASINRPEGLFVDTTGVIFIADTLNNRIRAVNTSTSSITVANVTIPGGDIETIAGDGTQGYMGDGGKATSAELNSPSAVFEDGSGNVYIADGNENVSNNRIREVSSSGTITTFAGSGTQCSFSLLPCGDGSAATGADLWSPTGVFVAGSDVLIADQDDDAIRTVSGGYISATAGMLLDTAFSGDGSAAPDASLRRPVGVAADSTGNVSIADTLNSVIRKVEVSTGNISTIAGTGGMACSAQPCGDGGLASKALLSFPTDVFVDGGGNIFLADYAPSSVSVIREISAATGNINTVAGSFTKGPGYSGDNGPATAAQISGDCSGCFSFLGVYVDSAGTIYIADTGNNVIRAVNTQNQAITFYAGSGSPVTIQPGDIQTIVGVQSTPCAVPTNPCGDGGPATSANLNAPGGVTVDNKGNIYVSDSSDNRVRIVDPSTGIISAFAGNGTACTTNCGDNGPAKSANLDLPQRVFADFDGNVFIADSADYEVREVTTDGTIHGVVDASQTPGFSGDGGLASNALLAEPYGLSADPFGNVFISDIQEWRIREVSGLAVTAPRAVLSTSGLAFSTQDIETTSGAQMVSLTNNGFGTALAISKVAISGTNSGDFAIATNTCGSSLAAGSNCSIGVTFTPAAKGNRGATLTISDDAVTGSQQNVSLSGTGLTATTTALASSANPSFVGSSVTFTATVTSSSGTPAAGSVTFDDGSTGLGSVNVNSAGTATFSTSSLAAGKHSITATYNGDASTFFAASAASKAVSEVVSAAGFALPSTGTLSPASVSAGGSATAKITITAEGSFNSAVSLSCSVSPAPAQAPGCSLNPVSLTPPGSLSSTLTVTTTAASAALTAPAISRRSAPIYAIWLLLPAMLLGSTGVAAPKRKKLISYVLLAIAISGVLLLVACGSSSSSSVGGGGNGGTPAGPYVITVTAKSGSATQTQTLNLTVQ